MEEIRYFCTPARDRNGAPCRRRPEDAPEKWERFKIYNLRDVETEMGIQQKLMATNESMCMLCWFFWPTISPILEDNSSLANSTSSFCMLAYTFKVTYS